MHYIFWLLLSTAFYAIGEYYSKKFAMAPGWSWKLVFIAILFYQCGSLGWFPAIKQQKQLLVVGVIWTVLSLAITVVMGYMIFGERISTTGIVGLVFAFFAVVLLSM